MTANTNATPKAASRRPLHTVNEVAEELNVSPRSVRRMITDGELASVLVRGSRRIPDHELDRYRG